MSKKCEGVIRYEDTSKVEGYQDTTIFVTAYCYGNTFHDIYQAFHEQLSVMSDGLGKQENVKEVDVEVVTIQEQVG